MAWFFQKISMGNFLIPPSLPMSSFEKSQTKKKTKATTKRMTTKTTKTKAIRSEVALGLPLRQSHRFCGC
jgi:hypothetical protein